MFNKHNNFFSLFRSHRPFRVSEKDLLITGPNCIFLIFLFNNTGGMINSMFFRGRSMSSRLCLNTLYKKYIVKNSRRHRSLSKIWEKIFSQFILFCDIARCSVGNTFSRGITKMGEWSEDNSIEDLTSIKSIVTAKSRISRLICRYFTQDNIQSHFRNCVAQNTIFWVYVSWSGGWHYNWHSYF